MVRGSSCHSKGEQGGRPVMAGMKCWWITSSRGWRRSSISGMVLHAYACLLAMPRSVYAANAAWGWLSAILAKVISVFWRLSQVAMPANCPDTIEKGSLLCETEEQTCLPSYELCAMSEKSLLVLQLFTLCTQCSYY